MVNANKRRTAHEHKARAQKAVLPCLVLMGVAHLFLPPAIRASSGRRQEDLSIRNYTTEHVAYEIAPADGTGPRTAKSLPPTAIHTFRVAADQDIVFRRKGKTVTRRLSPGRQYAFHYDVDRDLELYDAPPRWSDAVELAPFVATPPVVVDRMLALAGVGRDSVVYDLGCGDGRIVIAAAKTYGARGVGIDLDPGLVETARIKAAIEGVADRTKFFLEDVFRADIRPATVVTLYLLPASNALLRGKLEEELRPGSTVVSHNYIIPGWEAKEIGRETVRDGDGREHRIFLYRR